MTATAGSFLVPECPSRFRSRRRSHVVQNVKSQHRQLWVYALNSAWVSTSRQTSYDAPSTFECAKAVAPCIHLQHLQASAASEGASSCLANDPVSIAASIILFPLMIDVVQMTMFLRPSQLVSDHLGTDVRRNFNSLSSCFAINLSAAISVNVIPPTKTTKTVCLVEFPDNNARALTALSSPFWCS